MSVNVFWLSRRVVVVNDTCSITLAPLGVVLAVRGDRFELPLTWSHGSIEVLHDLIEICSFAAREMGTKQPPTL